MLFGVLTIWVILVSLYVRDGVPIRVARRAVGPSRVGGAGAPGRDVGLSVLTVPDSRLDDNPQGGKQRGAPFLRIGTLVLNNDLRHPAVVALEVLALESRSRGRIELGLGARAGPLTRGVPN